MPEPTALLEQALDEKRVLVCAGPGGVGKTTTAAVLARMAARRGRRTLVCTVDPARRLRDALGLGGSATKPKPVPEQVMSGGEIVRVDVPGLDGPGRLDALMLEPSSVLFDLVKSSVRERLNQEKVFGSRIYQKVASALPGALEYAAMAKLEALAADQAYDLIVLDTPPTQHALDFLEAPSRLLEALQSPLLRGLLRQRERRGWRLLEATSVYVLRKLSRFVGTAFLEETIDFLIVFEEALTSLGEKAGQVLALLQSESTGFALVTSTDRHAIEETVRLLVKLRTLRLHVTGVVATRVTAPDQVLSSVASEQALAARLAGPNVMPGDQLTKTAACLWTAISFWRALGKRDEAALSLLQSQVEPSLPVLTVPFHEGELHEEKGLRAVEDALLRKPLSR